MAHASAKTTATRTKRKEKRKDTLGLSNFGSYLASECKRAGTVEILHSHTPETLLELLSLTKQRTNYSGIADGAVKSIYHLSHIHPAKEVNKQIGLLHPLNLVIADKTFNLSRGTSYTAGGLYLVTPLQRAFRCSDDFSVQKVLALIDSYLGSSLEGFLAKAKLVKSTRAQQITRLVKLKAKEAPSTSEQELATYKSHLNKLSKADLTTAVEASGAKAWTGKKNTAPAVLVALGELRRLQPNSSLIKVLEHLEQNLPGFVSGATNLGLDTPDQSDCLAYIMEQCWRCLHHDTYSLIYNDRHLLELLIAPVEIPGGSWF